MLKFIKFFHGYLYAEVWGYSPERFLNLCSNQNIVLWNLHPTKNGYAFCISLRAFRRLKPILRKTGTRIKITRRCGLPFLLFRYRRHRFFLCGICCAFALLILLGQFVWSVEISGNSEYSNQVLSKFLAECGVAYGTWKGKIDCETLEMQLRQQFDDITWVSARLSGTRLYLTIQERLKGTTQASEDTYDAANLVADCSGVVDSIIVRTGTPLVKEGDSVSEGDLLVSGRVDILDDSKEVVSANYCAADADVWISTELSYESSFSTVYDKIEPTGKKNIMCELAFGKYVFDAGRNKCDETGWDSMTTWYPIRFGNDFYLPFQIAIIRQEQYEITSNTYTENEINAIAEEKFALYCEKLSKNTIQILSNSVMIEQNDLNVSVHGSLKALVKQQTLQEISQADMEEGTLENGINAADDGDSD